MTSLPMLIDLENTLRNEEVRHAAPSLAPMDRQKKADQDIAEALYRFETIFGDNARQILVNDYGMRYWVADKKSLLLDVPPSLLAFEDEIEFMKEAHHTFHLKVDDARRLLVRIDKDERICGCVRLYETGWAPLPFERKESFENPTTATSADNLQKLLEIIRKVLNESEARAKTYSGVMEFFKENRSDLLGYDLTPEILQDAPISSFTEFISALHTFAKTGVGDRGLKDPNMDAFLRHLIQKPHALTAALIQAPHEGLHQSWALVRHADADNLLNALSDTLVATTLPVPMGLDKRMGQPAIRSMVKLPLGPAGFQINMELDPVKAILLELGAALTGHLLER